VIWRKRRRIAIKRSDMALRWRSVVCAALLGRKLALRDIKPLAAASAAGAILPASPAPNKMKIAYIFISARQHDLAASWRNGRRMAAAGGMASGGNAKSNRRASPAAAAIRKYRASKSARETMATNARGICLAEKSAWRRRRNRKRRMAAACEDKGFGGRRDVATARQRRRGKIIGRQNSCSGSDRSRRRQRSMAGEKHGGVSSASTITHRRKTALAALSWLVYRFFGRGVNLWRDAWRKTSAAPAVERWRA